MLQTSPPSSVHDVAFPHQYSDVFAACGLGEIRVWHLHSRRELLRMSVPNLDCRCVAFTQVCAPAVPASTNYMLASLTYMLIYVLPTAWRTVYPAIHGCSTYMPPSMKDCAPTVLASVTYMLHSMEVRAPAAGQRFTLLLVSVGSIT